MKRKAKKNVISDSEEEYEHEDDEAGENGEGSQEETEDSDVERQKVLQTKLKGVSKGAILDKATGILDVKDGPATSKAVHATVAALCQRFTQTALADPDNESMKKVKEIPPPKNVSVMKVPLLDKGPHDDLIKNKHNNAIALDNHMVGAQEAIMAGLTSFLPVIELMIERGEEKDAELNDIAASAVDGIEMLILASNCLVRKRREMLRPYLQQSISKAIMISPMGGETLFSEAKKVVEQCKEDLEFTKNIMRARTSNRRNSRSNKDFRGGSKKKKRTRQSHRPRSNGKDHYEDDRRDRGASRGGGGRGRGGPPGGARGGGRGGSRGSGSQKNLKK